MGLLSGWCDRAADAVAHLAGAEFADSLGETIHDAIDAARRINNPTGDIAETLQNRHAASEVLDLGEAVVPWQAWLANPVLFRTHYGHEAEV